MWLKLPGKMISFKAKPGDPESRYKFISTTVNNIACKVLRRAFLSPGKLFFVFFDIRDLTDVRRQLSSVQYRSKTK